MNRISVITATLNVGTTIGRLYESLAAQTSGDFEWIVVDGGSRDNTVHLLEQYAARHDWVRYTSEPDCGLYSAINKGIAMATGDYYIAAGADDQFHANAIADYRAAALESGADVILARVVKGKSIVGGFRPRRGWISASKAVPGSHSVGMMFDRQLHAKFGMYSRDFPVIADSYFIKVLLKSRIVRFYDAQFVAGTFALGGLTTQRQFQILVETWLIQLRTERATFLQTLLFLGKLIVRYGAIRVEVQNLRRVKEPAAVRK